jgi:serine protease Do
LIDEDVAEELELPVSYGALISKGSSGERAITLGSPAEKAGLEEDDILLEFNGEKITKSNSLAKIILKYNPGDTISFKILRDGQEIIKEVVLGEWK